MTTEGVRGLAEVLSEAVARGALTPEQWAAQDDAMRMLSRIAATPYTTAALAWFDARLGSGEVVEAVARSIGGFLDPTAAEEMRPMLRDQAAAAVEAVRAALREGE